VHQRLVRNSRDLDALLLLDLSQSTNDWVPSAQSTVLNLAKEATVLVAHAMDKLGDNFAIHGFDSNAETTWSTTGSRNSTSLWGRCAGTAGRDEGQTVHPDGDGAAARGPFPAQPARGPQLILLLTDGEPHDIDVHDKRYLVHDAKRAVEDQRSYGIATFCLSLDTKPTSTFRAYSAPATTLCWTSCGACPRSCRRSIFAYHLAVAVDDVAQPLCAPKRARAHHGRRRAQASGRFLISRFDGDFVFVELPLVRRCQWHGLQVDRDLLHLTVNLKGTW